MNKWISVDFAVPSDDRQVLIQTLFLGKHINIYIATRIVFKNGKVKWRSESFNCLNTGEEKVTHWMPLPEVANDKVD